MKQGKWCPKCKQETFINVQKMNLLVFVLIAAVCIFTQF